MDEKCMIRLKIKRKINIYIKSLTQFLFYQKKSEFMIFANICLPV